MMWLALIKDVADIVMAVAVAVLAVVVSWRLGRGHG